MGNQTPAFTISDGNCIKLKCRNLDLGQVQNSKFAMYFHVFCFPSVHFSSHDSYNIMSYFLAREILIMLSSKEISLKP